MIEKAKVLYLRFFYYLYKLYKNKQYYLDY